MIPDMFLVRIEVIVPRNMPSPTNEILRFVENNTLNFLVSQFNKFPNSVYFTKKYFSQHENESFLDSVLSELWEDLGNINTLGGIYFKPDVVTLIEAHINQAIDEMDYRIPTCILMVRDNFVNALRDHIENVTKHDMYVTAMSLDARDNYFELMLYIDNIFNTKEDKKCIHARF